MPRRSIFNTVVLMLLAGGLVSASPTAVAAPRFDNSIGIVKMPDQVRQGSCGRYRLRWNFNPPTDGWTVTVNIRSPKGFSVAGQLWDADAGRDNVLSHTEGRMRVRLCGSSIRAGRYKIQMKMIYTPTGPSRDPVTVNRAPVYFRLLQQR